MDGLLRLKDQHGNDLYYGNAGDVWVFPTTHVDDYRERMKTVRHLELNDGDVILATFPRSGEIGDWKNWFTVAQNEQFDAVFKKRMSESELPFFFE